jgi:opacity protein-like surface antigen
MIQKTLLSAITVLALGTMNIQAESTFYDPNPAPAYAPGTTGPYIGLAYSRASVDDYYFEFYPDYGYAVDSQIDYDSLMFQAGYKYNPYIAFEFRYWFSMGDGDVTMNPPDDTIGYNDFDAWGIYLKPMYPVTPEFNIYGLLGFSGTYVEGEPGWDLLNDSDFSWGGGASFDVTPNISIFVDYVQLFDDTIGLYSFDYEFEDDIRVDTWNIGINYKF